MLGLGGQLMLKGGLEVGLGVAHLPLHIVEHLLGVHRFGLGHRLEQGGHLGQALLGRLAGKGLVARGGLGLAGKGGAHQGLQLRDQGLQQHKTVLVGPALGTLGRGRLPSCT